VAEEAEGVTYIETADGYAIYEVGSGSYLFSVSTEIPDRIGAIQNLKHKNQKDGTAYNLAGQMINGQWPHGIVITNGKKIAVK
jgi:hypothetical protein